MVNPMNIYIIQLAERVRNYCVEEGIIKKDQYILNENTMQEIVQCLGGELFHLLPHDTSFEKKQVNSYFEKTEDGFKIYYKDFKVMDILHELGHAFLEYDTMKVGDVRECNDINGDTNELAASKFARCFVMPSELFEKAVVKNTSNGVCNIEAVAEAFQIDYLQVVSHGRESYLWN